MRKTNASAARAGIHDDEITQKRRTPVTRRMPAIDEHLLAIARGELEPDAPGVDPFGGLIPVYDDNDEDAPIERPALEMVPRVVMRQDELIGLAGDPRDGFVLCQIDGMRTVAELADICQLMDFEMLDILAKLVAQGAIELV